MDKKVSELLEAINIKDEDIIMILQSGQNKKATVNKLLPLKTEVVILSSTVDANTDYTIPLKYKVGNNSLEVFYCSTKLQKRSRLYRNRRKWKCIKYNTILRHYRRFRYDWSRRF